MIPNIDPSEPLPLLIVWAGGCIRNPSYEEAVQIERYLRTSCKEKALNCKEVMELDLL